MNSKLHHGTRIVVETDLCTPNGIRTRAATLKGWCPRPLDDGGKDFEFVGRASEIYQHLPAVTPGASTRELGYRDEILADETSVREAVQKVGNRHDDS